MWNSTKSGLFLIEMIIAIACFSVASAMCTNLFVRARGISDDTRDTNMAVVRAQSVAECFKAADGSPEETARLLEISIAGDSDSFSIYYDSGWQFTGGGPAPDEVSESEIYYRVDVNIDESAPLKAVSVDVVKAGNGADKNIYSLNAKKYVR